MKVLFLDIDGVLNSEGSCLKHPKERFNDNPDPEHIRWLNHLERCLEKARVHESKSPSNV
jgi:histidinol phosphatase-like enzyme